MPSVPTGWVPQSVLSGLQSQYVNTTEVAQPTDTELIALLGIDQSDPNAATKLTQAKQYLSAGASLDTIRYFINAAPAADTSGQAIGADGSPYSNYTNDQLAQLSQNLPAGATYLTDAQYQQQLDAHNSFQDDAVRRLGIIGALGLAGGALAGGFGGGAGATGGSSALTGVTLPPSVAPTAATVGGLGPSIPATTAATAVGPLTGTAGSGAAASGLNWTTLVPSLVSGVTGVLGANAQADAAKDAAGLSREMFDIARSDALPRIQTGNRAVGVLDQVQGLTTGTPDMSRFYTSPDYQFNLAEGTKAGERALSAMGLRQSGPAVKEATRFASGLASREYGSFIDRLLATAGLGTTGAAQSAAAGANNAAIGGQAIQNRGAARSSGYGAVNDAVQGGIGNYLLQQYLNRYPVYG